MNTDERRALKLLQTHDSTQLVHNPMLVAEFCEYLRLTAKNRSPAQIANGFLIYKQGKHPSLPNIQLSYGCTKCQKRHFDHEPIYNQHIMFQSKEGLDQGYLDQKGEWITLTQVTGRS